jgi:hypothetical protein
MICEKCGREKGPNLVCQCELNEIRSKYDKANRGMMNIFTSSYMMLLLLVMVLHVFMALLSSLIIGDVTGDTSLLSAIISVIPNIVLLEGYASLYMESRKGIIPMKTTGFTIIKGYNTVISVLMELALIVISFSTIAVILYDNEQEFISIVKEVLGEQYTAMGLDAYENIIYELTIVGCIILIVVLALSLAMSVKMVSAMENIRSVARGNGYGDVSMFLIIMLFAVAGFSIISAISDIILGDIFTCTISIFSATIDILTGIILLKVRSVINEAMEIS